MRCPSCSAEVEEGADLCLECGEPMGDSPAARVVRSEAGPAPAPSPPLPASSRPTASRPPSSLPAAPPRSSPLPASPTPPPKTAPARKWARVEEPEPVRCPGCGLKSVAARCPNCGTRLRPSDE